MKKGDVVGIVKIKNEFDKYALRILSEYFSTPDEERKRGAPRKFKIIRDLPTKDEYIKLRNERYTTSVESLVDVARSDIESLRDELQEWYDNLPENFQQGDKGSQLEEAISELENVDVPDDLPDMEGIDQNVLYLPDLDANSRSARAAEAAGMLRAAAEHLREQAEKLENPEDADDLSDDKKTEMSNKGEELTSFADELESAADNIDNVCFPSMY